MTTINANIPTLFCRQLTAVTIINRQIWPVQSLNQIPRVNSRVASTKIQIPEGANLQTLANFFNKRIGYSDARITGIGSLGIGRSEPLLMVIGCVQEIAHVDQD